jgi:LPS sulfotransferase NodH
VAQAVSLFRAVETKRFHSSDGAATSAPPDYNAESIGKWLDHLTSQENGNLAMLQHRRCAFVNLCYEQMVPHREEILKLFARLLQVELPPQLLEAKSKAALEKIGDDWNTETEKRFRADRLELVQRIEAERRIKPYILARSNGVIMCPVVSVIPPVANPAAPATQAATVPDAPEPA